MIRNDKSGKLLAGKEQSAATHWSTAEYEKLWLTFFEALATSDLETAEKLLSDRCRKRFKRSKLAKLAGDFLGVAEKMAHSQPRKIKSPAIVWFREQVALRVEVDQRLLWDMAQSLSEDTSREAIRAALELCAECLRESLHIIIVEENGQMRIEV